MKINYVLTPSGKKLFSFKRHDYQVDDGVFIDGGLDYVRTNAEIHSAYVSDLIEDIREQFVWGKNYDKDKNRLPETQYELLKNLATDHIIAILIYFTERIVEDQSLSTYWKYYHLIFLNELKYRYENKLG